VLRVDSGRYTPSPATRLETRRVDTGTA
jgi:hypothetical protein